MTTTTEKALPAREILLVGPYGVLGTVERTNCLPLQSLS
jgi:hypothetical protein